VGRTGEAPDDLSALSDAGLSAVESGIVPRVAAGPLTTTVVGSYPQPDWLIDRARLGDRLPPRVRAREPAWIRKALEVVPPERLVVAPDMPDAASRTRSVRDSATCWSSRLMSSSSRSGASGEASTSRD
jgi:hypothetical protein